MAPNTQGKTMIKGTLGVDSKCRQRHPNENELLISEQSTQAERAVQELGVTLPKRRFRAAKIYGPGCWALSIA